MTTLAEQKSQLAKLMATENISVEHSKIKTAMFDTKNRVLYLPIWKDMSGVIYDLLGGHEVGHALYTPPEGWHNAATDKSKGKNYKSFLNVIEDARIEKKIKRKYPGLRSSFIKAYNSLFERDFFGIKSLNIDKLPFIDRLNIYTKSQYTADWIEFSPQEQPFIKKVLELETWDDVVRLTDEIYEYSKGEQLSLEQFDDISFDEYNPETDEYESGDDYDDYDVSENKSNSSSDGEESDDSVDGDAKNEKESSSPGVNSEDDVGDGVESKSNTFNRQKESSTVNADQYNPVCTTDDIYRENEMLLVDDQCKNYVYVNLPKVNLENCITPAKRVHELLSTYYSKELHSDEWKDKASKLVSDFKSRNERYISLLAKEFEMRKAAKAYSKSKISETGDLNISKLATYKFDDNIFRKIVQVPKGKSHGLILLLDRSGSMSSNMAGSIEQILVLGMFCRKVNIPFVVYGFGDEERSKQEDLGDKESILKNVFEKSHMTLELSNVFLREYLNSKMSNSEFSKAIYNMLLLKSSYENRFFGRPLSERLSNTPLTQAIIALAPIMNQFRKVNNLDITNLVVVHDGDADDTSSYLQKTQYNNGTELMTSRGIYRNTDVIFIRDTANKFESKLDFEQPVNQVFYTVMKWFKHVTKSKVFGFYISPSSANAKTVLSNHYVTEDNKLLWQKRNVSSDLYKQELTQLLSKFKTEKFLANKTNNFDEFYFVVGGNDLKTDDEEFEFDGKVTSSKLKNAFMKFNKKKVVNRVLVSRFIQGIAV